MKDNDQLRNEEKIKFSPNEIKFLSSNEACRIATISPENTPHVTPVSYFFEKGLFYFATDYETRKYKNIKKNPKIALVVDVYSSLNNKAVVIHGRIKFIERGTVFERLYDIFDRKFEWVRQDPWIEGEAPFVEVNPYKKISWGLD